MDVYFGIVIIHVLVGFLVVYFAAKAYKKTKYMPMLFLTLGFFLIVLGILFLDILFMLTDESSLQIIKLLDKKQLSAQMISSTLNIPLSSTYRKIKKLEQLKIIKVVRTLDGLDQSFYTLWMKEIKISYRDHKFSINIRLLSSDEKIVRLWQKFKS